MGSSDNLIKLNKILSNTEITNKFINGDLPLTEASILAESDRDDIFYKYLKDALNCLEEANSYAYKIKYNESNIDLLKNIVEICKAIRNTIQGKKDGCDF
ncbi:MAG: hypothetical protein LUC34_05100 [Campylobacter sp.]|nr:hypothetical protein [Campylobacter sp.]